MPGMIIGYVNSLDWSVRNGALELAWVKKVNVSVKTWSELSIVTYVLTV